jgi:23S rRNA pseudouridine955/2504/2580 synthase
MLSFIIKEGESDQTLISFLKKGFKTTPLSLIYKLFRTKKVKVNGEDIRYYHHRLKLGEEIIIYDTSLIISKPNKIVAPKKSEINIEVIYEDKNVLIVLKEHGMIMPELDKEAQYYFYQQNPQEYQELTKKYFVFTSIHRLDRLTKGLVIYPKNPTVKKILYNSIGDKEKITKKYLAICENTSKKQLPAYISGFV